MRYKRTKKALPVISRELGADVVLEGTVTRAGNHVRITAQLIRGATDTHIWSGSFERDLGDVLSLQRDIARNIAAELRVTLSRADRARLDRALAVEPEAYESYLKGWHHFNRYQFAHAASYFEQATRKDPRFALAYALLYEADAMAAYQKDLPLSERALAAMAKARRLDGTLAEVHTDVGDVKFYWEWNWVAGEAEFRRAVDLNPGSVDAATHYALCLHALRRWEAALQEYRRVQRLDPVSPRATLALSSVLADMHRDDLALEQIQRAIELDPASSTAWRLMGHIYLKSGRETEAVAADIKAESLSGRDPERIKELEKAAHLGGVRGYWAKRLSYAIEDSRRDRVPPMDLAPLHMRVGDENAAIRSLEQAFREHAPRLVWINAGSRWDSLRSDPRFQALLKRMNFPNRTADPSSHERAE